MPVLKKLVEEYAGALALARVNTDEQRELSRAHKIRSLQTMRLYKNDSARKSLLALFNLRGESDARVGAWRRSLFNALH